MAKQKLEKFFIANSNFEKQEVEGIIKSFDECPNEQWGFRKVGDSFWNVTHIRSGLEAVQGKTQADCTKQLKNIFTSPKFIEAIHHTPSIDEAIEQRKKDLEKRAERSKKFNKLKKEFKELTGITCPVDSIIGGLDIIKLDEILKTPDGISTADYIKSKYGDRAEQIIDEMVH